MEIIDFKWLSSPPPSSRRGAGIASEVVGRASFSVFLAQLVDVDVQCWLHVDVQFVAFTRVFDHLKPPKGRKVTSAAQRRRQVKSVTSMTCGSLIYMKRRSYVQHLSFTTSRFEKRQRNVTTQYNLAFLKKKNYRANINVFGAGSTSVIYS